LEINDEDRSSLRPVFVVAEEDSLPSVTEVSHRDELFRAMTRSRCRHPVEEERRSSRDDTDTAMTMVRPMMRFWLARHLEARFVIFSRGWPESARVKVSESRHLQRRDTFDSGQCSRQENFVRRRMNAQMRSSSRARSTSLRGKQMGREIYLREAFALSLLWERRETS